MGIVVKLKDSKARFQDGEVDITGKGFFTVEKTEKVKKAINQGLLKFVRNDDTRKPKVVQVKEKPKLKKVIPPPKTVNINTEPKENNKEQKGVKTKITVKDTGSDKEK